MSLILVLSFAGCSGKIIEEEETTDVVETTSVTLQEDIRNPDGTYKFIITLEDASSEEAQNIIETFSLNEDDFVYERLDENGDRLIVYDKYTGQGYDAEGREYNDIAHLTGECIHCGLLQGIGENMCNGTCNISFEDIPAGSISSPENPNFVTSK